MLLLPATSLFMCLSVFASAHSEHHRRRLAPHMSIINALNEQLASGIEHPRFTLTADFSDGGGLFTSVEQVEVDVVLTQPSVGQSTSFSVDGGASSSVQTTSKFFVSDQIANETLSRHFAILSVDDDEGLVSGLVQKDGKLFKLEQRQGGSTFVTEVNYEPPKDWKCTVVHDHPDPIAMDPADPDGRRLTEVHDDEHHHHDRDHTHHDHHLHHQTINHRNMNLGDILAQLGTINRNVLRNRRRLYATDTFPNKWSYQVDLYIEIDGALVKKHDPNDAVNMPNTIAYVNALITAASSIYEREVDTHLHVLHIAKTTLYDGQTSTSGALDVMYNQYSSQSWHYVDPITGESPDLHHAILYRSIGGGIAYLGTVCDSDYGYGVSAGIQGSMSDFGGEMFWDISVITHEIGHNFGADHTHDISGFNPKVDACGDGQCTSLVNGQYISAGESNIGFTFGGQWNGGDRSNINNWINNDGVVPFSQEPKRVPKPHFVSDKISFKVMYEHVSTRGSCVEPYIDVPSQICSQDSHCDDGNSCTTDSCNAVTGTCSNVVRDNCCGNLVCEAGESGGSCSDCGPFTLTTSSCSSCWIPHGVMFDVEAIKGIVLTSLTFRVYRGSNTFNVYSAPGSYSAIVTNKNAWTRIASNSVSVSDWTFVQVDFTDIPLSAGTRRAFYIATSAQLIASDDTNTPLSSDDHLKLLNPAGILPSTEFQYLYSGTYSW
ncbi:hypothetical protein ACHAWX_002611 [Stephanocyclus meneghinianus]